MSESAKWHESSAQYDNPRINYRLQELIMTFFSDTSCNSGVDAFGRNVILTVKTELTISGSDTVLTKRGEGLKVGHAST